MSIPEVRLAEIERQWLLGEVHCAAREIMFVSIEYSGEGAVVSRLKEVVEVLQSIDDWESPVLENIFPNWFVRQFAASMTKLESDEWLRRWRNLPDEKKKDFESKFRWSFEDWIYWLHPERRAWYISGAKLADGGRCLLEVAVSGWPTPMKALVQLLLAAGATEVKTP